MGACTSVPRAMKAEITGAAPPPEPPKEEAAATAADEKTKKEIKAEVDSKEKEKVVDDEKDVIDDEKVVGEDELSLEALLKAGKQTKDTETGEKKEAEGEALPISDLSSTVAGAEKTVDAPPVSDAASEEKKPAEKEKK